MARLARIEVRDKFAPSSPTLLAVVGEILSAESEDPQPGVQHLTVEMPITDQAVAHCVKRRVLRRVMSDGTWREYRIARSREVTGTGGNRLEVTALDPLLDLGPAEIIRDTLASGIVEFDIGLVQATVTEIVDNQIIARLAAEYSYFQRGTIEPTAKYDVTFDGATPLEVLKIVAEAAADPVTKFPAEYQVRQTAGGFMIDVLAEIGSTQAVADVRSRKNLRGNTKSEDTDRMATVMVGFGADDGSGQRTTISRAAWKLDNESSLTYEITDPEGGPSPVLEDDQLNGFYVVPNGIGPLVQITDTAAGNPATVTLASSTGITEGEVYELRASAADVLVTEIDSPSKSAAPPTGYGRVMGRITREDLFGARNFISNPWFRTWTTPASPPDGWTVTSGAGGSTSQNTDPLYTEYGGASWKVMNVLSGGSVHTLKSPTFFPRPVNGASTFAVKAHLFLEQFTGDVTIRLLVMATSGVHAIVPLAQATFIPPDYPHASSAKVVAVGDYADIGIEGMDFSAVAGVGVQLHIEFNNHPLSGGAPGTSTAYLDAVMLTQTAKVAPMWIEFSGSNALWHACNLALVTSRDPIASYDTEVLDLTRLDGVQWKYDELVSGATIRLTDRDGTVDNELIRIMAIPRRDWLNEADTRLTLATRQQRLADLLGQSSGAASVGALGPGGGAATPPTPTPPGPTPGPGSGPTAPVIRFDRTIATTRKLLPAMAAAEADIESDSGERFFVDLTGVSKAYCSLVVVDDDSSPTTAQVAIKYLRPSDLTWRFLDGSSGPYVPLDSTGLVIGSSVFLEADAQGPRWCKRVTVGGDATASPSIGFHSLHVGSASPSVVGDWSHLIAQLGGDAEVAFFYDFRHNVNMTGAVLTNVEDVRGAASGFGPNLLSYNNPTYNAITGVGEFTSTQGMNVGPGSTVDLSGPFTLIYVGSVHGVGTGKQWFCRVGNGPGSQLLGARVDSALIAGEAFENSTTTTIPSAVGIGPTAVRVVIVSQDGGTGMESEVLDDTAGTASLSGPLTATSTWIDIMAGNGGISGGDVYAYIGVKHVLTAAEKAAVRSWAAFYRNAAFA